MMADGDDPSLRIKFPLGAGPHFAHGHQNAALNARLLKFPGLADIEQDKLFRAAGGQQITQFPGGKFITQHIEQNTSPLVR